MEMITRALQRARQNSQRLDLSGMFPAQPPERPSRSSRSLPAPAPIQYTSAVELTRLDEALLRRNHVIAFDPDAGPTRHYDILRNQIRQRQAKSACLTVAVTAPGRTCGTTVTAMNLAFSFARMHSQRVALFDASGSGDSLDRKLGLYGKMSDRDCPINAELRDVWLQILPASTNLAETSPWQRHDNDRTVIIADLPPLLTSDAAMAPINMADVIVVVFAEGHTTYQEVEACKIYLKRRENVQYVLNNCGSHGL
jgi:protein-tyrosine kinase